QVTLHPDLEISAARSSDLVTLDDALSSLAELDARKARIVELRFFGGLNEEETAEVLQISAKTVQREWIKAKAWLYYELSTQDEEDARRRKESTKRGSSETHD